MAKYNLERLGPLRFETLVQALLEKPFRNKGVLTQFGPGPDGGREATWTQPPTDSLYVRPSTESTDAPKHWVFQVKYHDTAQRGWDSARRSVEQELDSELSKIIQQYKLPCHKYILITNVPFTGLRHIGTRDRISAIIEKWSDRCPEIEVWDASDLSRMLDADPDTRATYLDDILPGDVLRGLLRNIEYAADRRASAFRSYLLRVVRAERAARTEDAGDLDARISLDRIFVDLPLRAEVNQLNPTILQLIANTTEHFRPRGHADECLTLPASLAFLKFSYRSLLLLGGPGVGKSTITQFVTLYHAARLVDPSFSKELEHHLREQSSDFQLEDSDVAIRFPFRLELRRVAKWIGTHAAGDIPHLAAYIALEVNQSAGSPNAVSPEDIFGLARQNAVCLILDGLDEVPDQRARATIFDALRTFLNRCDGERADVQVIVSSRPQGYRKEFDAFEPMAWVTTDLEDNAFLSYATWWLKERIIDVNELGEAHQHLKEAMTSAPVANLARTLLQATVILTLVAGKQPIPAARHPLFKKYVDVIFTRERYKETVRGRENELLRLHERVGYEIMRSMEQGRSSDSIITFDMFRTYIYDVMASYGANDLNGASIGSVAEEFLTLAHDRLCLLAGKGESEETIDFLIPQFREYFAASYFASHERAAPEKVFALLTSRGQFWLNVLQFYVATQSPALQRSWLLEADSLKRDQDFPSAIRMISLRRSLLQLLPEMSKVRVRDAERFLDSLFDLDSIWTLKLDDNLRSLSRFLPQESCWRRVSEFIARLDDLDRSTYRVCSVLWMTLAPIDEEPTIDMIFAGQLSKGIYNLETLTGIAWSRRTMRLSMLPSAAIAEAIVSADWRYSWFDRIGRLCELDEVSVVELSLCFPQRIEHYTSDRHAAVLVVSEFVEVYSGELLSVGVYEVAIERYLRRLPVTDSLLQSIVILKTCGSPVVDVFVAVAEALIDPCSPTLHCRVRALHGDLPAIFRSIIDIDSMLGPPPSWRETDVEWITWKKMSYVRAAEVVASLTNDSRFKDDAVSFFLMCKPEGWHLLRGVIGEAEVEWLLSQPIASFLSLFDSDWFPFRCSSRRSDSPSDNLADVLSAIVSLCEAGQPKSCFEVPMWDLDISTTEAAAHKARECLAKAAGISSVPQWCLRGLRAMAVGCGDLELDELGEAADDIASISDFDDVDEPVYFRMKRIADLALASHKPEHAVLAANLASVVRSDSPDRSWDAVRESKLLSRFQGMRAPHLRDVWGRMISSLFPLPLSAKGLAILLEECDAYGGEDFDRYYATEMSGRLWAEVERSDGASEREELLTSICRIVNAKNCYGAEFLSDAIECAIRLQELPCEVLRDVEWQEQEA